MAKRQVAIYKERYISYHKKQGDVYFERNKEWHISHGKKQRVAYFKANTKSGIF